MEQLFLYWRENVVQIGLKLYIITIKQSSAKQLNLYDENTKNTFSRVLRFSSKCIKSIVILIFVGYLYVPPAQGLYIQPIHSSNIFERIFFKGSLLDGEDMQMEVCIRWMLCQTGSYHLSEWAALETSGIFSLIQLLKWPVLILCLATI